MNKYTRDVVLMLCIACAALSFEKCTGKSDGNTSDKNAVETVDNNKVENDAEEETNETTKIKISEGTAFTMELLLYMPMEQESVKRADMP